jgi:hypothetical protein
MQSITPIMAEFLGMTAFQWIMIVALIGLVIFYMQYKKKNM